MSDSFIPEDLDLEKLIDGWIRLQYTHVERKPVDDLLWAHTVLDEVCDRNPTECLRIISLILARDPSDVIAGNLAAGPLEDLLSRWGPAVIEAVEAEARSVPQFRKMLGGLWRNVIREDVWDRIQALRIPGDARPQ
jgi:hypothetical protein